MSLLSRGEGNEVLAHLPSSSCVECGAAVVNCERGEKFYSVEYGVVRLKRCHVCGEYADKYCEMNFAVVAIGLVLHSLPAYRHLLLNNERAKTGSTLLRFSFSLLIESVFFSIYSAHKTSPGLCCQDDTQSMHLQSDAILLCPCAPAAYFVAAAVQMVTTSAFIIACWLSFQMRKDAPSARLLHIMRCLMYAQFGYLLVVPMTAWSYPTFATPVVRAFVITSSIASIRAGIPAAADAFSAAAHVLVAVACSAAASETLKRALPHLLEPALTPYL